MHASPAGQRVSDYRSAAIVFPALPDDETLIIDKGVAARLAWSGPV
jgi:hypothetical protein